MKRFIVIMAVLVMNVIVSCVSSDVLVIRERQYRGRNLTSFIIPPTVTKIGDYAFHGNKLTSIIIPESVTEIGDYAFSRNNLTSLIIPASVKKIGISAFWDNKLTNLTISDGVTEIDDYAFDGNNLTSLIIPASVKKIGGRAFVNNKLTTLTISDGVTEIGWGAFDGNELTSLIIPASVKKIGASAFYGNKLTNLTITMPLELELNRMNQYPFGDLNINYYYVANNRQNGTYTILGNHCFFNNEEITDIILAYERAQQEERQRAEQQAREALERDRRENAFVQVFRTVDNNNNYSLKRGIHVRAIDGVTRLYNTNYDVETESDFTQALALAQAGWVYAWYRLSPGLHSLDVEYRSVEYDRNYSFATGSGVINTTNGRGTITLNFEAGKVYKLNATEGRVTNGSVTVQFSLVETNVPIGALR